MKRTALALILTSTLLILILVGSLSVDLASANFMPYNVPDHDIEITADGNVTGTDKIQHTQNVYTFTGKIFGSIVVLRDNITINGAGYALQGSGYPMGIFLRGRSRVTIENMTISNFAQGVVYSYNNEWEDIRDNILSGNIITNNSQGITCYASYNITVSGNKIMNNDLGISCSFASGILVYRNIFSNNIEGTRFINCNGDKVYGNSFINNTSHVTLDPGRLPNEVRSTVSWDNGSSGNYWSNYNGTDADGDGISETPYIIDNYNQDNYPLMTPIKLPIKEPNSTSEPFPTAYSMGIVTVIVLILLGSTVYILKRKR